MTFLLIIQRFPNNSTKLGLKVYWTICVAVLFWLHIMLCEFCHIILRGYAESGIYLRPFSSLKCIVEINGIPFNVPQIFNLWSLELTYLLLCQVEEYKNSAGWKFLPHSSTNPERILHSLNIPGKRPHGKERNPFFYFLHWERKNSLKWH